MEETTQYISAQSLETLRREHKELKEKKIPDIARRIDEAKQQGDLSENAEYHQAREDMSWARGRLAELDQIINNAKIITTQASGDLVTIGSAVTVKINGQTKILSIVGPQEVNPAKGLISNESPLGRALIGHKENDKVEISAPAGKQVYEITKVGR